MDPVTSTSLGSNHESLVEVNSSLADTLNQLFETTEGSAEETAKIEVLGDLQRQLLLTIADLEESNEARLKAQGDVRHRVYYEKAMADARTFSKTLKDALDDRLAMIKSNGAKGRMDALFAKEGGAPTPSQSALANASDVIDGALAAVYYNMSMRENVGELRGAVEEASTALTTVPQNITQLLIDETKSLNDMAERTAVLIDGCVASINTAFGELTGGNSKLKMQKNLDQAVKVLCTQLETVLDATALTIDVNLFGDEGTRTMRELLRSRMQLVLNLGTTSVSENINVVASVMTEQAEKLALYAQELRKKPELCSQLIVMIATELSNIVSSSKLNVTNAMNNLIVGGFSGGTENALMVAVDGIAVVSDVSKALLPGLVENEPTNEQDISPLYLQAIDQLKLLDTVRKLFNVQAKLPDMYGKTRKEVEVEPITTNVKLRESASENIKLRGLQMFQAATPAKVEKAPPKRLSMITPVAPVAVAAQTSDDANIWTEKGSVKIVGNAGVMSGQANQLLIYLTAPGGASEDTALGLAFVKACLSTYHTFITPEQMLAKLIERFRVPPPAKDAPDRSTYKTAVEQPIQLKVSNMIKRLLTMRGDHDLARLPELRFMFAEFVAQLKANPTTQFIGNNIQKTLSVLEQDERFLYRQRIAGGWVPTDLANFGEVKIQSAEQFVRHFNPSDLAKQITLLDAEMFTAIGIEELHNAAATLTFDKEDGLGLMTTSGSASNSPGALRRSSSVSSTASGISTMTVSSTATPAVTIKPIEYSQRNLRHYVDHTNSLTVWTAAAVLQEETVDDRRKMFERMILLAQCLRQLNNFHSAMAVLAGLNTAGVARLRFTLKEVSPKLRKVQLALDEELNSELNYSAYRAALKNAQQPLVPLLGAIVADLVMIETHVRDRTEDGAVDWNRRSQLAPHYSDFMQFQQSCQYPALKRDDAMSRNFIASLEEMQALPSSLLRVSLGLEPKDGIIEGHTTKRSFAKTLSKFSTFVKR